MDPVARSSTQQTRIHPMTTTQKAMIAQCEALQETLRVLTTGTTDTRDVAAVVVDEMTRLSEEVSRVRASAVTVVERCNRYLGEHEVELRSLQRIMDGIKAQAGGIA